MPSYDHTDPDQVLAWVLHGLCAWDDSPEPGPDDPDWMKPAILLAAASGCRRISYDCDARATPEVSVPGYPGKVFNLPVYDW